MLICGCINGMMGVIDVGTLKITQINKRAHMGTIISCIPLNKLAREFIVS